MTCQGRTNQETKGLVCAIHLNHCKAVWHCRLQVHRTLKLTNLWVYVHILSPMVAKTKTDMVTIRSEQTTSVYISLAINKYSDTCHS